MSRLKVSEDSNHTIQFTTPSGVDAGENIAITFPSDFATTSVDYTDIDITDDGAQLTLAATPNTTTWGVSFGGTGSRTLTITSGTGTVAASSVLVVKIGTHTTQGGVGDQAINNPTTNNTYVLTLGGTFGDSGSIAVAIVLDDQVVLSATVDPSITFSLSGNASTFGTLTAGIVDTADTVVTLTVGTNGNGGYMITVRDTGSGANPGLYSVGASSLIGSADGAYASTADLSSVPLGYGMQAACTAGCTTGTHVNSDYRQAANTVGAFTLADKNVVTYNASTASDHTITNTYKAKASSSTKAGVYTDTLTYIATATF